MARALAGRSTSMSCLRVALSFSCPTGVIGYFSAMSILTLVASSLRMVALQGRHAQPLARLGRDRLDRGARRAHRGEVGDVAEQRRPPERVRVGDRLAP